MENSLDYYSKLYVLDKNISTNCHNYIPGYSQLFDGVREKVTTMLEIGIGSVENHQMGGANGYLVGLGYKTGNSLRCWRDYFSHATIYGIDLYHHNIVEDRIVTLQADQSSDADLTRIVNTINKPIHIIIDDGSHIGKHQAFSFMFLEKFLAHDGIYVIEDVQPNSIEKFKDLSIFPAEYKSYIENKYNVTYFDTRHIINRADDFMVAFTRK
jgi:8-demethyl-8-alpha-L-rhamnosyltetracenomycin-C 2'-O-methyltransferase